MAADGNGIAHIALTTNFSAAMGALSSTFTAWIMLKKPDITMTLNGCLAGLVAITAPCAVVSVPFAGVIGALAGVIVVFAIIFFDKVKVDDPVGATSVHLVCGVFGTLCVAIFGDLTVAKNIAGLDALPSFGTQLLGVAVVGAYAFGGSMAIWLAIKMIMGVRVQDEEEKIGLDITEHGVEAYPGFLATTRL